MNIDNYEKTVRQLEWFHEMMLSHSGNTKAFEDLLAKHYLEVQRINNFGLLTRSNFLRLFKIDQDLSYLFTLTDNKPKKGERLPFPLIFIESKIPVRGRYVDENESIVKGRLNYYGLLLVEVPVKNINFKTKTYFLPTPEEIEKAEEVEIKIFGVSSLTDQGHDVYVTEAWLTRGSPPKDQYIDKYELNELRAYIANFLDFLNDPEVEIVERKIPERKNVIRAKHRRPRIPRTMDVRIPGKMKIYLKKVKRGRFFQYSHRFWVRGHWRTLSDERFVNKQGQDIWIVPFIKGEGILIQKNYLVKKPKADEAGHGAVPP